MGHYRAAAIFTHCETFGAQGVMASALIPTRTGFVLFWNTHNFLRKFTPGKVRFYEPNLRVRLVYAKDNRESLTYLGHLVKTRLKR